MRTLRAAVLPIAATLGTVLVGGLVLLFFALREQRRTQSSLRESEAATRAIIDAAEDAFVGINQAGFITDWNDRAEIIFGWARSEVVDRRLSETIIPPHLREAHEQGLERFLATGEGPVLNRRIDIEALHRDGHTFPVELAIWPVESNGG